MQGAAMSSASDPSRMDPYSDDPTAAPGQTAVLDRQLQEREQLTDDGDHDRFAHYVRKDKVTQARSEEHTSELQSRGHLVCRLLLEKKNRDKMRHTHVLITYILTSMRERNVIVEYKVDTST